MRLTHTHSYATLEIAATTFADIKARLEKAGVLKDYLTFQEDDESVELIIFGTVALVEDPKSGNLLLGVLKDANDICRSMHAIVEREGKETNWLAFRERLEEQLKHQHNVMLLPMGTVTDPPATAGKSLFTATEKASGLKFSEGRIEMQLGKADGQSRIAVRMTNNTTGDETKFMLSANAIKALLILGEVMEDKMKAKGLA